MSIVTIESDFIHYEVLGRGRPLIFLHGWVGSWRYWIPTMQVASISYRAYALDLWGFGDTVKRPEKYSIDQQASLINSFMDELGIGKIAMVGHGLGAIVALSFVQLYPNIVDRVMLTGLPMQNSAINPRMKNSSADELAEWLLGKVSSGDAARNEVHKTDIQAIRVSLEMVEELDLLDLVFGMTTPCLFVHGASDPAVEMPSNETVALLPENTHQVVFEDSGHFPMLDESNKYNRLLVDFLALQPGESPRDLQLKEEWKRRIR